MNIEDYAKEVETRLKDKGLNVSMNKTEKNGQDVYGITLIKTGRVCPTAYINPADGMSVEETTDAIYKALTNAPEYEVDIDGITNADYIKENVLLGVERKNDAETYVTRDGKLPETSEYLYVKTPDGVGSFRINEGLISAKEFDIDELFKLGKEHTGEATTIKTMKDTLIAMGVPEFAIPDTEKCHMFIVSQENPAKGAAASVLCEEKITDLSDKLGTTDFVLIPSSIYECILVPDYHDGTDLSATLSMVGEVNQCVDPLEQLGDKPYHLSVDGEFLIEPLEDYLDREAPGLD